MKVNFIEEYLDFLNTLNIIFENDNLWFKVTRKNIICPSNQLGTVVEKYHIGITIDKIDTPFTVVYVDSIGESMRIKYNPHVLDEILMCLGGTFTEYYELYDDEIHRHVNKFERPYFKAMIHQLIVNQKRVKVVKALYGLTAREVRGSVLNYAPTWTKEFRYSNTPKQAPETLRAIRTIIAELYDDRIARVIPFKIVGLSSALGYEIFASKHN